MGVMNAWEPIAPARSSDSADDVDTEALAFTIARPRGALTAPLVFASPHSGRIYPADMMAASALDGEAIRRSEDAYVDQLIAAAADHGVTVIAARLARVYRDGNRDPRELD